MKYKKIKQFFTLKKKQDFFTEFWSEFVLILKDILRVYKNFLHWAISKIIINIWALLVWVLLALPFVLFAVFVALIDPIPWGAFLVYQMQGITPYFEVLEYAQSSTFSFVLMTVLMLAAVTLFIIGNAYSNILYTRLYKSYIAGEKLPYRENIYISLPHIKRFVSVAAWILLIIALIGLVLLLVAGLCIILFNSEIISFEIFSYALLGLFIISIFIASYILFRLLFSVIILSLESSKKVLKQSAWQYIKKSFQLTAWVKKYTKFLFVLAIIFLVSYPFQNIGQELNRDISQISNVIEYRALELSNPEWAAESSLRDTALYYEDLSDEELFANYRGARMLGIFWSLIGFIVFSGLYMMALVSFYFRILVK